MNVFAELTTLDVFLIVSSIVVAIAGFYLIIILRRFAHISRVADRVASTVERFQDLFSFIDKIPTDIVRRVSDHLPSKKK